MKGKKTTSSTVACRSSHRRIKSFQYHRPVLRSVIMAKKKTKKSSTAKPELRCFLSCESVSKDGSSGRLTWSPVTNAEPSFHLPKYFGILTFE